MSGVLRAGAGLMTLAAVGFVGYGVVFFIRNFTDSFLELGIRPAEMDVDRQQCQAFSPSWGRRTIGTADPAVSVKQSSTAQVLLDESAAEHTRARRLGKGAMFRRALPARPLPARMHARLHLERAWQTLRST